VKPIPRNLRRIVDAIRRYQSFCVIGHVRPDGDCIGSQLALTMALRNRGKTVECWNEDVVPGKLAFLDKEKVMRQPASGHTFDCVIATDCASWERLGECGRYLDQRQCLINIDHHGSNRRYGDLNWIVGQSPSTGELIFRLLRMARWGITPPIADCLFTAISTDTGSFQFPTTRPATFQTAGELVRCGANLARITDEVYASFPLGRVRLLRHLLNEFRLTDKNRIAYYWLDPAIYAQTGANEDDSEGLIDHLRAMEPVIVACIFEEMPSGGIRISLRSKDPTINVNEVASQFGGGGHAAAAGARIPGSPNSVQRRVLAAVRALISTKT